MANLRALFWPAILINIAAVLIGTYFYQDQLSITPAELLIFVPDCPLYVLFSLLIILGLARSKIFSFIVSVGMVKYGLWTVFALLFHWGFYSQPLFFWTTIIFIIGHIGMAAEGLALLPLNPSRMALALALAWFLLNDASDYFWGTVPSLPPGGLELLGGITIASSILLPLLLFAFAQKIGSLRAIIWLKKVLRQP